MSEMDSSYTRKEQVREASEGSSLATEMERNGQTVAEPSSSETAIDTAVVKSDLRKEIVSGARVGLDQAPEMETIFQR
jgi:hypothetical protein